MVMTANLLRVDEAPITGYRASKIVPRTAVMGDLCDYRDDFSRSRWLCGRACTRPGMWTTHVGGTRGLRLCQWRSFGNRLPPAFSTTMRITASGVTPDLPRT